MWNPFRRLASAARAASPRHGRARAPCRPRLEALESRFSPGDVLLGAALGAALPGSALLAEGFDLPARAGESDEAIAAPAAALSRGRHGAFDTDLDALGDAAPLPIPGGSGPFGGPFIHLNLPGPADAPPPFGNEASSITDFIGFVGAAQVQGTGTGTDTTTGARTTLLYDLDLRFMQGVYRGVDGNLRFGTFAVV